MSENPKSDRGAELLGILVLKNKSTTRRHELLGPRVHLGRARGNDIRLDSSTVSERHARLDHHNGFWVLTDAGSRNGTYLNGRRIDRPVPLREEDTIAIGDFILRIESPPPLARQRATIPMPGRPKVSRASLVLVDGARQQPIALKGKLEITLGTDPSHDVVLSDPMASSTHCLLRVSAEGLVLEDLSSNGTFVDGSRLGAPHILRDGDVITFGHPGLAAGSVRVVVMTNALGASGGAPLHQNHAAAAAWPPRRVRLRDTEPPDEELVLGPGLAPHADLIRQFLRDAVVGLFGDDGEGEPKWKRLKEPVARCLHRIGESRGYDEAAIEHWCLHSDEYPALRVELTELVKRRVGFEPPPSGR
jgi:pSer/pThr/pTyr-binding forkhead associated (FHA) protein